MTRRYDIAVVGFGVAGAAVSFLLARAGHAVTLLERAPEVGPVGAGILLQPSGQEVLRRLGILDEVARNAEAIDELHAVTHRGRDLIRLRYRDIGRRCQGLGVHRGALFAALHGAIRSEPVRVLLGREIRGRRVASGKVCLVAEAGCEEGPFDWVIAADGSRSALRDGSGLVRWRHEYPYGALWAMGPCTAVRGKLHQVVRGTQSLAGLLPMGNNRCSLFWGLHRDDKELLWSTGFPAWKNQVVQLCPQAEELLGHLSSFDAIRFTSYQHVVMRRWYDRHTIFIGDAAHAMSPHLGQGVNLALLDAWFFVQALENSGDFHEACRQYSRRRARHLRYYAAVTFLLSPFFQSSGLLKGWGRDVALPLMVRVPWMRREMLHTLSGLKGGFLTRRSVIDG